MSVQTAAVPRLSGGWLATLVASRFVLNAIFRLTYPLVPFLALRFGVSERTATSIITVQVALGLASLLGGWLGDRIGYRRTMLLGLAFTLAGVLGITVAPTFAWLLSAYALCGIGGALYLPAMQAYVSALTSYEQRGRAIGLVELSWALAGLLAVPLLLRAVEWQDSIQGAFLILVGGVVLVFSATMMLPDDHGTTTQSSSVPVPSLHVVRQPAVFALFVFLFLGVGGNEVLFVAQAPWSVARFGVTPTDLGLAAFLFGVGELGGSALSALFTDRLGKLRASLFGFTLAALVFLLLPLAGGTWTGYLGVYALYGITIEFAIVAAITLSSTISVHGRATVMALAFVSFQIGRALGSQLGVPLLREESLAANSIVAASAVLIGVVIAWRGVKESRN